MGIKISVVMASYLGQYTHCADDRIRKFHRAVNSFVKQNYQDKELIIVSDGCSVTINESQKYVGNPNIKLHAIEKQPQFSGNVRNYGCNVATGDVICYLDTDDFIGNNHLNQIGLSFDYHKGVDWIYFDDNIIYNFNPTDLNMVLSQLGRDVKLAFGSIGTSSIAHKRLPDINWIGCNGYGHDWTFIKRLIDLNKPNIKIYGCQYNVCHIPNSVDC